MRFELWLLAVCCVGIGVRPVVAVDAPLPRELWTTSNIKGSPEPPSPYRTEAIFPTLRFDEPLEITAVPGAKQLAIVERHGKIFLIENQPDSRQKTLLIDVGRPAYGLAFHPDFQRNRKFYVTSILDPQKNTAEGTRVSEFTFPVGSQQADRASERVLIEWPSGGHNGGCLRFGPDGMLYISTGDGSGIADELQTGQDLSDLLGSMLRIDVDHPQQGKTYAVPKDNPFVGLSGARSEIWSYGHRQVWKFSFDSPTGQLWAGEIGQDLWEMIYLIQKGGNYGWSVQEGSHPFRPARKLGPSPILKPIVEHAHVDFRSITGGYVYHGQRLPELRDAYIYGDFDTGKVWSLRYVDGKVAEHRELVDTSLRVIAFAQDATGEVFILDFAGGIHRLVKAPPPSADAPKFPRLLSQTGLFSSTRDHKPAKGLLPYTVNSPLWSDGAAKDRFLALPGNSQIEFDAVVYPQPPPGAPAGWRFPDGTVLVKTFSLELEAGNPQSQRRLETRVLHRELVPGNDDEYGAQVWHGYTFVWNDEQTDAELLESKGLDRVYEIKDAQAPGGKRQQTWHFPSRAECTLCHTMSAKYVLGIDTLQMNKQHNYGSFAGNQLDVMNRMGMFTKPLPKPVAELPKLVNPKEATAKTDDRARSYLHANCAHCHRKWGGGNAEFHLLAVHPLAETGTVNVRPGQGNFGLADARYITPGKPEQSLIAFRMNKTGLGRMPHVGSNEVDREAVKLIEEWIRELK